MYLARDSSDLAITLTDDVTLLMRWLCHDILTVAGLSYAEQCVLYDFVVAELKSRMLLCSHRLLPVCRLLENQRDDLLAFARVLNEQLERLRREFQIPMELLRQLLGVISRDERDLRRWREHAALQKRLRG